MHHVTVAFEPGRFKGWPANYGLWVWEDEVLVMYEDAISDTSDINRHTFDPSKGLFVEQARSKDGGKTWRIEKCPILRPGPQGKPWNGQDGPPVTALREPINFHHPDFAILFRSAWHEYGPHYFFYTYDRGRTWHGPYALPSWKYEAVFARTCFIADSANEGIAFLSGGRDDNNEDGAETFMVRTRDGGINWEWVARSNRPTPEQGVRQSNFTIMPAAVRISPQSLLCLGRCTERTKNHHWIEAWASGDDGATWSHRSMVDTSNSSTPPALLRLPDLRLVLTYGYRIPPFGIRARISEDNGRTWGDEIVLRSDGGNFDLGYTRNVLLKDGSILTAYYFNDDPHKERRIEATLWHIDQ